VVDKGDDNKKLSASEQINALDPQTAADCRAQKLILGSSKVSTLVYVLDKKEVEKEHIYHRFRVLHCQFRLIAKKGNHHQSFLVAQVNHKVDFIGAKCGNVLQIPLISYTCLTFSLSVCIGLFFALFVFQLIVFINIVLNNVFSMLTILPKKINPDVKALTKLVVPFCK
ncbi:hypothetical protein RFI_32277, partial [Reticulomyxa filosa]